MKGFLAIAIELFVQIAPGIISLAVGGVWGSVISIVLKGVSSYLLEKAKHYEIEQEIIDQLKIVNEKAAQFFELQKRIKDGEEVPKEEKEKAKQEFKDAAKDLIKLKPKR